MENSRAKAPKRGLLRWSVASSAVINAFMISAAVVGPNTLYRKVADAIAAPPGIVANRFFAPREHSVSAFLGAALLSLAFSFVFYGAVSWILVRGFIRLRSLRRHTE
ncbi:MAG TPA: hypothetical protein VG225_09085 [Terracidiphilus sp.]|jgi:hypothetical protein|nr:hypothetical protein [Terracidiphilus sp.]